MMRPVRVTSIGQKPIPKRSNQVNPPIQLHHGRIDVSQETGQGVRHVRFTPNVIVNDLKFNTPENVEKRKIEKTLKALQKAVFKNHGNPTLILSKLSEVKTLTNTLFEEGSTTYKKIMAKILVQEACVCSSDTKKYQRLFDESNKLDPTDDKFSMFGLSIKDI